MSTSTALWATASKEWIIQPKPKPGRKPKKDTSPTAVVKDSEEVDTKGRRNQNRVAQRAFRERKQSQFAELQARILSYERGEIERSVALQNIAKRLKEENERLRQENSALKEKVSKLEGQQLHQGHDHDKKRWRENSPPTNTSQDPPVRKRSRITPSPQPGLPTHTPYQSSPSPMVSTPDSGSTSELHFPGLSYDLQADANSPSFNNIMAFSSDVKGVNDDVMRSFTPFDCGFCCEDTHCVCRDFALNQAANRAILSSFKTENRTDTPSIVLEERNVEALTERPQTSILENLPAYQPPVPLRRRQGTSPVKHIFPVFPMHPRDPPNRIEPTCSGDPANCAACNDDAFGKAFCSAIEDSIMACGACEGCPARHLDGPVDHAKTLCPSGIGCCGNPLICGSSLSTSSGSTHKAPTTCEPEYIPTNDAWRQIKAHPNIDFADLSLLAEVVASRSKCAGPRITISPPPGHLLSHSERSVNVVAIDRGSIPLTDSRMPYQEKEKPPFSGTSSPLRLVPQEILLECGRRRLREVHSEAVRDALRLLDAKFR